MLNVWFSRSCLALRNTLNAQDHTDSTTHTINPSIVGFIIFVWLSQANLADFGNNQWVTCFQETAEALLGHSAETLGQLRDTVRLSHTLRIWLFCTCEDLIYLCWTPCCNLLTTTSIFFILCLPRMRQHLMQSSKKPTSQLTSSKTESSWRLTT